MITNIFIRIGFTVGSFFLGILPQSLPDWLMSPLEGIAALAGGVQSWSVWLPFSQLRIISLGLLAFWAVIFFVKLFLKVWAFIPFIGGSG